MKFVVTINDFDNEMMEIRSYKDVGMDNPVGYLWGLVHVDFFDVPGLFERLHDEGEVELEIRMPRE